MLLRNAQLVDPEAGIVSPGALLLQGGKIVDRGAEALADSASAEIEQVDLQGAALAPGIVDMRVFIGEPGERHKESFGSGGEAAVAGGVTTIVTQPDTAPAVDDPALLDFIHQRVYEEGQDHAMPHVKTMAALTKGLKGEQLSEYAFLLEAGAIALSDGANVIESSAVMRRCLQAAAGHGALVACATQDPALSADACATEGAFATRTGLPSVPAAAEAMALERDLALVAITGAKYHAAQISTRAAVEALRRAKAAGLDVTAAVSAPHATLCEEDIGDYRTFMKLTPPLRSAEDREAIVDALADGSIDCIVSAHRAQTEEAKRRPFAEAASGAVGLETLLSASLELVMAGAFDLPQLFKRISLTPAQRLGLPCGRLSVGSPADLVVFAPYASRRIDRYRLRSKSKNSPYDRRKLSGRVLMTFVEGRKVYEGAEQED
ncbi:MAG: dihydroorotase [Neomegalonema sp.]|nr:dihydroorotase [Neomegalonema sp.]